MSTKLIGKELLNTIKEEIEGNEYSQRQDRMAICGYGFSYEKYYQAVADAEGINIDEFEITNLTLQDIRELAADVEKLIMNGVFYYHALEYIQEKNLSLEEGYALTRKIGLKVLVGNKSKLALGDVDFSKLNCNNKLRGPEFLEKLKSIPNDDLISTKTIEECGYMMLDENRTCFYDFRGFFVEYIKSNNININKVELKESKLNDLALYINNKLSEREDVDGFYRYIDDELRSEGAIWELEAYAISKMLTFEIVINYFSEKEMAILSKKRDEWDGIKGIAGIVGWLEETDAKSSDEIIAENAVHMKYTQSKNWYDDGL